MSGLTNQVQLANVKMTRSPRCMCTKPLCGLPGRDPMGVKLISTVDHISIMAALLKGRLLEDVRQGWHYVVASQLLTELRTEGQEPNTEDHLDPTFKRATTHQLTPSASTQENLYSFTLSIS
ncbi:hypothetical protein EYF80_010963 [Liparis tanakae]|uniref:Uncharacterized protein n=1 Tax=Liparis tanakae TaxID=230148 RepID=A0A4Z2INP0_9TELE|nr:hypothetical protein EYF80_010963 [Liparis tanakae]